MATKLISINQAVRGGMDRLREPQWANPMDHFKIGILGGVWLGPWMHLYSPFNKELNGRDPVDILIPLWYRDLDEERLEVYEGPLPDSPEYQAEVKSHEGVLSKCK